MTNYIGLLMVLLLWIAGCDLKQKQQNTLSEEDQSELRPQPDQDKVLLETLDDGAVKFEIYGRTLSSLDTLMIAPSGFEIVNDTTNLPIDGHLTAAFMGDINQDDYTEFYLVATSAGSGSYATLYAYASYRNKSFGPIYYPELDTALLIGYMGHDEYVIENNKLLRKFPVYLDGDTNAQPSGGERVIEFELIRGEASFILRGKEYEGSSD